MTDDKTLCARLRDNLNRAHPAFAAADRIEALTAEVAMLRAALRAADDRAQMRQDERDRAYGAQRAIPRESSG